MHLKRSSVILVISVLICAFLTACSGEGGADAGFAKYSEVAPDENGMIIIPAEEILTDARFFNYDSDGVTVQLVALRDGKNGVHIAFNTCQSCSPSPKAYYQQSGKQLKCANCGFTFEPEEVGITHGGCNPWPISGAEVSGSSVSVPAAALESMRTAFISWKGPTK